MTLQANLAVKSPYGLQQARRAACEAFGTAARAYDAAHAERAAASDAVAAAKARIGKPRTRRGKRRAEAALRVAHLAATEAGHRVELALAAEYEAEKALDGFTSLLAEHGVTIYDPYACVCGTCPC